MITEFVFAISFVCWAALFLITVKALYSDIKKLEATNDALRGEIRDQDSEAGEFWDYTTELNTRIEKLEGELRRIGSPSKKITFCRDGHEESVLIARAALGESK